MRCWESETLNKKMVSNSRTLFALTSIYPQYLDELFLVVYKWLCEPVNLMNEEIHMFLGYESAADKQLQSLLKNRALFFTCEYSVIDLLGGR